MLDGRNVMNEAVTTFLKAETAFNNTEPKSLQVYFLSGERLIRIIPANPYNFMCGNDVFIYEYTVPMSESALDELENLRINKKTVYKYFMNAYYEKLFESLK